MQKKKDVLFLCQFFYPEYISSATLPYDTAKALVKAGLSVGVLCGYPKEYNNSDKNVSLNENHAGIEIMRLKYVQVARNNIVGRLINYFSFTFAVFFRILELNNYKSVIVYSNPPVLPLVASIANKFFEIKIVYVCYDVYPEIAIKTKVIKEKSLICKVMNIINKFVYKNVSRVVALSCDMKELLLKNRSNLNQEKVVVIPNWYEDEFIKNIQESYDNNLFKCVKAKDKLVVSYFGNMGTAQDLDTFLNAIRYFKIDDQIVFLIAGHGNKLHTLKETVKNESLRNVFIFDFLQGEDYKDALNISDIFIVSLKEGLTGLAVPSKTYSYMMAGKPIIAIMGLDTDIIKDLIRNNAGFGIEVGDVNGLVDVIGTVKRDSNRRRLMGINARRLFEEKYNTQKCTSQYIALMNDILEDN